MTIHVDLIRQALSCGKQSCACARRGGKTHCPAHDDGNPSLSVNDSDGKALVHCHAGCAQDAVIAALGDKGLWNGTPNPGEKLRHEWPAHHAKTGKWVADHMREDTAQGKRMWWWPKLSDIGVKLSDLALYRADVMKRYPARPVVLVEGEKAADALATIEDSLGVVAVASVTGADGTPGEAAMQALDGRIAYLWADADDVGAKHMGRNGVTLGNLGCRQILWVDWQSAPPKGDAADAIAAGCDIAQLLRDAHPWVAPSRNGSHPQDIDIRGVVIPPLADLLAELRAFVQRYVVLGDHEANELALWIVHTHAFASATVTPYQHITSAEKESGKTLLLEVLSLLVARPWHTGHTTAAALYRKVDKACPTLLLDESDNAFKADKEYAAILLGVLNTGYKRSGRVTVCVGQGAATDTKDFSTFCPKAIAGIGKLPDTAESRSIPIVMKRKLDTEVVEWFTEQEAEPLAEPLCKKLAAWALDAIPVLQGMKPNVPNELRNRAGEVWRPLLVIADLAGGGWPKLARDAALALSGSGAREDDSLGVRLLTGIKAAFGKNTRLSNNDLVKSLNDMDDAPWGGFRNGEGITTRTLASMLRKYDIHPHTIRVGVDVVRGYESDDFVDAWARYAGMTLVSPISNVTSVTRVNDAAERPIQNVTRLPLVTFDGVPSNAPSSHVTFVTDKNEGVSVRERTMDAPARCECILDCPRCVPLHADGIHAPCPHAELEPDDLPW